MRNAGSKQQLTIGYMSNDLLLYYNRIIQQGIVKSCEQNNLHNIIFLGGELHSPYAGQKVRNRIYNLVNKHIIDGLIINAATIFNYSNEEQILAFCNKFQDIPIVSIGKKIPGHPVVLIENKEGLYKGIVHLIKDHGHKRIAFIKGPETSYESEIRFSAYKEALEEFGIDLDTKLIVHGNFDPLSGIDALKILLERKVKMDALVASNDDMALGALGYALERGISVPNTLAILGFDDIENASDSSVPLTTVRQPFISMAEKAVLLLKYYIEKESIPEDINMPTELIIRRSCGCFSETLLNAGINIDGRIKTASPVDLKKEFLAAQGNSDEKNPHLGLMQSDLNKVKVHLPLPDDEWEKNLVDSFISFINSKESTDYLALLDAKLNQILLKGTFSLERFQNSLSRLITISLPYLLNDVSLLTRAECFWHQLRILFQEYGINSKSREMMQREKRSHYLMYAGNILISVFDLEVLKKNMLSQLPRLNIEACYISLYDQNEGRNEYSRIIFGYSGDQEEKLPVRGIRYKTRNLLPSNLSTLKDWNHLIVDALFFENDQYGFILIKTNPGKFRFEAVRQQISIAIKGALMARKLKKKERIQKKLLQGQKKQSKELEKAYNKLRENQKKMLIIEKMAALGRMTAGIAHEINTPLAAVRASLLELKSLAEEYEQSIGKKDITDDDHREIVFDIKNSLKIADNAISRAAEFVQSIKAQTRDLSTHDRIFFKAIPIIQDAILLHNHELLKNNCKVNFTYVSEDTLLFGLPGKFSRIISNLITNSIDAYKEKGGGLINIELKDSATGIDLRVKDRGIGMGKDILSKIYDPLFTT
ncbi:MAG: substrate-binding domain-containing protein, partial [Spirochaetales bacterium]|nr:substrate-binding domain-containing protein [Spirochaetales bacterium]